jgi:hypothetical protein
MLFLFLFNKIIDVILNMFLIPIKYNTVSLLIQRENAQIIQLL